MARAARVRVSEIGVCPDLAIPASEPEDAGIVVVLCVA
jgi:hypothetical protein